MRALSGLLVAAAVVPLVANRIASSLSLELSGAVPYDDASRALDFYQCDRECRWQFGFFNRSVIGVRRAQAGIFHNRGHFCKCFDTSGDTPRPLNDGQLIERLSKKPFDSVDTWSGDFNSPYVCTQSAQGTLVTIKRTDELPAGGRTLHCGKCAVCSAEKDLVVLPNTREWITHIMTAASSKFAKPGFMGGTGDPQRLKRDLTELLMNFSDTPQPEFGGTSCMDCWTDNIMNDANLCKGYCWTKFFKPSNPRSDITKCKPMDFNCLCLKCDEDYSGSAFIKCAGANRRSSGIISDIERPANQQCTVGKYYGVADADLPTLPEPSHEEVERVLNHK